MDADRCAVAALFTDVKRDFPDSQLNDLSASSRRSQSILKTRCSARASCSSLSSPPVRGTKRGQSPRYLFGNRHDAQSIVAESYCRGLDRMAITGRAGHTVDQPILPADASTPVTETPRRSRRTGVGAQTTVRSALRRTDLICCLNSSTAPCSVFLDRIASFALPRETANVAS